MDDCDHSYPVIDEHEGTTVCCDCGKVLDEHLYVHPILENNQEIKNTVTDEKSNSSTKNEAMEILNRLNLSSDILNQLSEEKQNVNNLYNIINKNSVVTTKEFCAASGMNNKKLVKLNQNKVIDTNINLLLEKYCTLLELSYRDYTLIKAELEKRQASGHPPLTIIGFYIFQYCKKHSIKKFMKNICSVLGISVISIQRYQKFIKDEFSRGS